MADVRLAAAILIRQTGLAPGTASLETGAKALGVTLTVYRWSRVEVIEAGQRYVRALRRGEQVSDDGYYAYRRDHPGEPSLQVIKERHGGIRAVVRDGQRRDWRERAVAWDSRKKRDVTRRRESARASRLEERKAAEPQRFATESGHVPSERTLSHLLLFAEEREVGNAALAAHLGVHRVRAQQIIRELRGYGALEPTVGLAASSLQSYRLTRKGYALVREIKKREAA